MTSTSFMITYFVHINVLHIRNPSESIYTTKLLHYLMLIQGKYERKMDMISFATRNWKKQGCLRMRVLFAKTYNFTKRSLHTRAYQYSWHRSANKVKTLVFGLLNTSSRSFNIDCFNLFNVPWSELCVMNITFFLISLYLCLMCIYM